jgi:hypothetical protein
MMAAPQTNYAADLAFLAEHTKVIELVGSAQCRVLVAPQYQGRVMTSTLDGKGGRGFGWINAAQIESAGNNEVFNNYGGEDRFWLGPEGGQFSLWFKNGQPMELGTWRTPPGFNEGAFDVTSQGRKSVAMAAHFDVTNYSGTEFHCAVKRTVSVLDQDQMAEQLGVILPAGVKSVAFKSSNVLANLGEEAWTIQGGLLSIWVLGQFRPLPRGRVIVPFIPGEDKTLGAKATTDYFGPLPAERCSVGDDRVLFACDGRFRSKIGVSPARAKGVLGSYDPDGQVLTVIQFNQPGGAAKLPYVNSLWELQDKPFAGDAINSYNDATEETHAPGQSGGFYEMETSSPAAALAPGAAITHCHRTYHFAGSKEDLAGIAKTVLGVELGEIG